MLCLSVCLSAETLQALTKEQVVNVQAMRGILTSTQESPPGTDTLPPQTNIDSMAKTAKAAEAAAPGRLQWPHTITYLTAPGGGVAGQGYGMAPPAASVAKCPRAPAPPVFKATYSYYPAPTYASPNQRGVGE